MFIFKIKRSTKYKATITEEAYFITITTVGWIDVFTRINQKHVITNYKNKSKACNYKCFEVLPRKQGFRNLWVLFNV